MQHELLDLGTPLLNHKISYNKSINEELPLGSALRKHGPTSEMAKTLIHHIKNTHQL
jgi:hypothetical protein